MEIDKIARKIRRCTKCPLSSTRVKAVPGEGTSNDSIMLVGESPGRQEDLTGSLL